MGTRIQPKRDLSIFGAGTLPVANTVLFKGEFISALEDGKLLSFVYYSNQANNIDLQIWRPTGTANEYQLKYTNPTVTPASAGAYELDVSGDNFDVYIDDVIGMSFVGTLPIVTHSDSCSFTDIGGVSRIQESVLTDGSYYNSLGTTVTFTDGGTCYDYFLQAIVRYLGKSPNTSTQNYYT